MVRVVVWAVGLLGLVPNLVVAQHRPQTAALTWEESDLSSRMMDGAHQFVERKIREAEERRGRFWNRDFGSLSAYQTSIAPQRRRLAEIIGAVDVRLDPNMEHYGDDRNPAIVAQTARITITQVRWPVLPGLYGYGLMAVPNETTRAWVIVIPDAGQSPESLLGIAAGVNASGQLPRRLADSGIGVIVPQTVSRERLETDDERLRNSDQTYREWIYRQAFHMGRHVIGYEVQTALAAVDWVSDRQGDAAPIGIAGYAEGGLTAFYAAAIDTRIDACLVSGYFDSRQRVWSEPIYRNVWSLVRDFGDAEIASLILPRTLVVEHSPVVAVADHKGEWATVDVERARQELRRIPVNSLLPQPVEFQATEAYASPAVASFASSLGVEQLQDSGANELADRRTAFSPAARHKRYVSELEAQVQMIVNKSEHVRDARFLYKVMPKFAESRWSTEPVHPTQDAAHFVEGAAAFRSEFLTEGMGQFDEPLLPPNARTRLVAESSQWRAYDVVLDVYPELFAWGILVVPNDLQPGERRPVVVCQHGRNGVPRNLLDADTTGYRNIAAKLAERGFVTFAPHNLYRGEDRYRWLDRKANSIKATLFSFIIASHDQITRWLSELPFVDDQRIAFYGLSYGGETAVRVPPILTRYCLSICSGDFNQWTRKVASTDQPFSFMRTIEWEMPYWNLGQTFDYAEMAYLMIPRPFMVERGHNDLVGRDQWVAHEYAKVRWLYTQLGLADRTRIEFFQGGHSMRAEGTVDFLHEHLRWPQPPR